MHVFHVSRWDNAGDMSFSLPFISRIGSSILYVLFFVYAARYLGPQHFGVLCLGLALIAIGDMSSDAGLKQIIERDIARDRSVTKKYIGNILWIKIILMSFAVGMLVLFVNLVDYSDQTRRVVYLLCPFVVFNGFLTMLYGFLRASGKGHYESTGTLLMGLLALLGVLVVMVKGLSIAHIALFYSISGGITLVYILCICVRTLGIPNLELEYHFLRYILKEALPFGLIGIFAMMLHWIDVVMLSLMQGDVAVGWYQSAYRFFFSLLCIPAVVTTKVFSAVPEGSSQKSIVAACEKSFRYVTMVALPVAVGITLLADRLIIVFFGSEYRPAVAAAQIVIWVAVAIFMGVPFSHLLKMDNRYRIVASILGISAALNIFLNLLFIPRFSYLGASWATVISQFLIFAAAVIATARVGYELSFSRMLESLVKAAVPALIMGSFIAFFRHLDLFLLISFSAILYCTIIYFTKGFDM